MGCRWVKWDEFDGGVMILKVGKWGRRVDVGIYDEEVFDKM